MKRKMSIEEVLEEQEIHIARSTVVRNIRKIQKESKGTSQVINIYQNLYVPNMQKSEIPESLKAAIEELPEKQIIIKNELEDLYQKLFQMKKIVEETDGNISEATRRINEGTTSLGKIRSITPQGLRKNMLRLKKIEEVMQKERANEEQEKE